MKAKKASIWVLFIALIVLLSASVLGQTCTCDGAVYYNNGTNASKNTRVDITYYDGSNNLQLNWSVGTGNSAALPPAPSYDNQYKENSPVGCAAGWYCVVTGWDIDNTTQQVSDAVFKGQYNITIPTTPYTNFTNMTLNILANPNVSISSNATSATVPPSTNASYLLNITNNADGEDTFNLTFLSNATASVNSTSIVNLSPNQSWYVLLNVSSASGGAYQTNVTASSNTSPSISDTIYINTTVQAIVRDVNITANQTEATIYNESFALYEMNVTNQGNSVDNITLIVNSNATATLNQTIWNNIPAGQSITAILNVSNSTPGNYFTNVTAISSNQLTERESAFVNTTILETPRYAVLITPDTYGPFDVYNDTNATFLINITNTGNQIDNYTLTNSTNSTIAGLNETTITDLAPNTSYFVELHVGDDDGGVYQTNVSAWSDNNSTTYDNTTVYTNVTEIIRNVTIQSNVSLQMIYNDTSAEYLLNITNLGTITDDYTIINSTNATTAVLNQTAISALDPYQSFFVRINISDSTPSMYETNITVTSDTDGGITNRTTIYTNITQVPERYNVSVTANETGIVQILNITNATYLINITNLGNYPDNFTLYNYTNASVARLNETQTPYLSEGESYFVLLEVGDGNSAYYQTNVTAISQKNNSVYDNATVWTRVASEPPTPPSVDVYPETAYYNTDLVCNVTVESNDPEGEPISYYYNWYNNSVLAYSTANLSQTSHVLDSSNTTAGENWNCTVVPYDGVLNGTAASDNVTVLNTAPTIQVNITPDNPSTIDNLTCLGRYHDVDLQAPSSVNYVFSGDYSASGAASCVADTGGYYNCTATVLNTSTDEGDNITCTMTPNDGFVSGAPDSDWVEVAWVDAPSQLIIYLNTTDKESVILEWTASPTATSYAIYWSSNSTEMQNINPYFLTPDATTTLTNYTDFTAGQVENRYYRVAAVKSPAYELEPQTGGKRNKSITAGRNLISFPLEPENSTLNDVITPPSGSEYDRIARYAPGTGWERSDYYGTIWKWYGDYTTLELDRGYFMYPTKTPYTITTAGILQPGNRSVNINTQGNLIGWTSQINRKINDTLIPPSDEDRISRYTAGPGWERTDYYTGYGWFGDFDEFEPGVGYWLYPVGSAYTFEYDPYAT